VSEKKLPFVSVIISTRNEQNNIGRCLDSILKTEYPKDKFEVVVVDGSTDDTAKIVERYPVRLIKNIGGGAALARNIGIRNAKGSIVALVDADTTVHPNWLIELVKCFGTDKRIMSVGGQNITPPDSSEFCSLAGKVYSSFLGGGGTRFGKVGGDICETYHNPGCNVALKRETFDIVGPYTESIIPVGEDLEMDARIREHGYKLLYTPKSIVYHRRKDGMKNFLKQSYVYGAVRGRLTKMHWNLFNIFLVIPSMAIISFPIALLVAFFYPVFGYVTLTALILYLLVCFLSALKQTNGVKNIITMVAMYMGHHLCYGLGFLKGMFTG